MRGHGRRGVPQRAPKVAPRNSVIRPLHARTPRQADEAGALDDRSELSSQPHPFTSQSEDAQMCTDDVGATNLVESDGASGDFFYTRPGAAPHSKFAPRWKHSPPLGQPSESRTPVPPLPEHLAPVPPPPNYGNPRPTHVHTRPHPPPANPRASPPTAPEIHVTPRTLQHVPPTTPLTPRRPQVRPSPRHIDHPRGVPPLSLHHVLSMPISHGRTVPTLQSPSFLRSSSTPTPFYSLDTHDSRS